jgi:hypothetical protein
MAKKRRVDLRKILANPDLRRELMVPTIQATQAREGIDTTRSQAERAYYVVTEGERTAFFDLERFRGGKGEPDRRHEMFVRALRDEIENARFDVARRDFGAIEEAPLAYRRVGLVAHIFRESPALQPGWGTAVQGLATAADDRFVRHWWEVNSEAIGQGKNWVPFAKGGEFSRFYADVYLVVQWISASIRIMEGIGRVQNVGHYFKPGLTWPRRTAKGFNMRVLPEGCIFADKGPALFPISKEGMYFLLGVTNTSLFEYLFTTKTSFSWEVGIINSLPIPAPKPGQEQRIADHAKSIFHAKAVWDGGNEISTDFRALWLLRENLVNIAASIPVRLDRLAEYEATEEKRIRQLYVELNDEVYRLYGIPESTRKIIEETVGERPPEVLWPQMEGKSVEQKRMEHVWRLLSYVVKRVIEADEDGIVPFGGVAGEPGMVDQVRQELAAIFPGRDVNQIEVEIVNELKRRVKGYRRCGSLSEWLDNVFFELHCSLYKNRPIFWHIASGQGTSPFAFSALVHYHRFDKNRMAKLRGTYLRDAIEEFRRESALADKDSRTEDRMEWQAKVEEAQALDRKLQWIQEGYHGGPDGGDRDYRILTPWKEPDERPKGWDPDIDDGVKVNIAPFEKAGVLRVS